MRFIGILALGLLAGCGEETAQNKAASGPPATLPAGQYEVTAEVAEFRAADDGRPRIDTPVGTRSTRSVCIGDTASAELFTDEGFTCEMGASPYIAGGRMQVAMSCTIPNTTGAISVTVNGNYTADGFEGRRLAESRFTHDGDVVITAQLRGRRTGDCTPGAAPAAPAANASGNAATKAR